MISLAVYFDSVRESLFNGTMSRQQVDGQFVIISHWDSQEEDDLRWLAYMLATVYHECARKMWPIREIGKGRGRTYGRADKQTGQVYYGRGFVQLTWKYNYERASSALGLIDDRDLVTHPDMALDSLIATRIMFRGMTEGWFTSKKLSHYFNEKTDDPINARRIINNDVSKNGKMIAGYHEKFLTALKEAEV